MSDKRLDFVLYGILTLVIAMYMLFNVFIPAAIESAAGSTEGGPSAGGQDNGTVSSITREESAEGSHAVNQKGFHLFIDLDRTLMYVYRDGLLAETYPVSGGRASSPSPIGTWKIISKDTWGEGFGGAWLGFNVPWGMYGIHGTTEPWFVGVSNTSQGCIRMRNEDVLELYKLVPYGATVTIVYENRPFHPMKDGDVGSDVLAVEKALKRLGYYNGSEDGIFGDTLKAAVRKFQEEYGLYNTGLINISTYELIMQLDKELEQE